MQFGFNIRNLLRPLGALLVHSVYHAIKTEITHRVCLCSDMTRTVMLFMPLTNLQSVPTLHPLLPVVCEFYLHVAEGLYSARPIDVRLLIIIKLD